MKTKITKTFKSFMATLLALLIILSTFPLSAFASTYITDMNSNADFGVVKGSFDKYGHEMHYAKYDGKTYIVFCCQFGVESPDGSTYEYGKEFRKYVNREGDTYENIADYIAFGYTLQYGDGLPSNDDEWEAACCTQQYVWEKLGVNPARSSWNSNYMSDSKYKKWKSATESLMDEYYKTKPSFNGSTKTLDIGGSAILTDSNGVFKYYPTFEKTVDNVTFSHTKGKNTLTISVSKSCTKHSVKFKSLDHKIYMGLPTGQAYNENTMNYVYFEFEHTNIQNVMFSNYVDPQTFSINVDVEFGSLKLIKTSEDNIVGNITFNVSGNGINGNYTTNNSGEFQIDRLVPGTYTVTEITDDRYVTPKSQTVKVENGKTATVSFNNILKRSDIQVIKISEDNYNEGHKFHLYGTSLSGAKVDKYATTNSSGVATFKDILIGTGYTLEEVDTAIRYVIPDKQTAAVEWEKVNKYTVDNILKKFCVTVVKSDIEKGIAQGDAKLSGATYGLYKGETLMAKYTTDDNYSFTTDYFPCDDDWTLREISASEGYLVNETVCEVGAKPELYKVEFNKVALNVVEMPIKGNIAIIKHTDDGSTKIETPESGAEFQVYLKSAGSYAKAKAYERDTIVCDEDGFGSTKLLPYGTYTVHQTKGWAGRELIKDFDVFISSEGKTYKYLINNSEFCSYLKVVKLDKETGKQIAYEGAGFEIYDSNNHRVSMQFTYPQVTSIHTFYTNSEGYLITPEKLPYGEYTLKEVQAPYGYVLDDTPIPFSIKQENSSTDTGVTVVKVKAHDMSQKGTIDITKTGEIFASVNENENIFTPVFETSNLSNAVFEIYAAEDVTTLDGTVRYQQGELVDEITTGKDGVAKSKELYLGKYTIVEKTAPNGYVNANEQYNVELTYVGQNVSVTSTALSVNNDRQKVMLSLAKTMEQNEIFGIGMNDEILSVQFGVFANEDIKAADGTVIPTDALITFANCDENGKITFDCDLPIGFKFYVKEIATDEHYILSDTKYEFETTYAGQDISLYDININDNTDIENNLIYGSVKGLKIDRETNATIKGAVFGLFKANETEYTENNAILTAESDENGVFVFNNIPYGSYVVKELKPADNYLPNEEYHHITVNANEQIIEITVINDMIPEIKTMATVDGEKEICATEVFTLVDTVEYKHLIPEKEYVIKGILMDKNTGKALVIDGKEITSEVTFIPESPSGTVDVLFTFDSKFIKADTSIVVFESLYRDGKELTIHADIDDEDQTVTVKIPNIKTTAKVNGKKTVKADKDITITDTVSYENLTVGKEYTIKGILMNKATNKPFKVNGKEITAEVTFIPEKSNGKIDIEFTFDSSAIKKDTELVVFETLYRDGVEIAVHTDINDEGQTVTINAPKPKTPKTGDDKNYGIWLGLVAVGIGGIISAVIIKVKSKKEEDDD